MKTLNSKGPGLVWGIPTLGRPVPLDWALALKGLNPPINYNVTFCQIKGQQVAEARNAIAAEAVKLGAKYLFFLGDDVVPPPHTIRKLIYRMENNEQIGVVGGIYCSKCDPPAPLVFRGNGAGSYWDWKVGEFFECTGLGMDCTLIRVDLFNKISEPWFKTVDGDNYEDGINAAEQWTEDLYFCEKVAKETEYKIYCDASIICDHWNVYANKKYTLPAHSLPLRQRVVTCERKLLLIGPEIQINGAEDMEKIWVYDGEEVSPDYRCAYDDLPFGNGIFDWVIVSHPYEKYPPIEAWLRVIKPGGKLSINFSDIINRQYLPTIFAAKYKVKAQVDGTFITLTGQEDGSISTN